MKRFVGKVALITGGSSGLGAAVAKQLALEGAKIVIGDVRDSSATVEAIRGQGGEATAVLVDISSPEGVQSMVAYAVQAYGGIDVLHANAGIVGDGQDGLRDVTELDLDLWDRTFDVNARGTMLCIRYAVPEMVKRGGGSIVITSSISAQLAENVRGAYSASKAAVDALTRHVATAFGRKGIRCNAIAPGLMRERVGDSPDVLAWSRHVTTPSIASYAEVAPVVLFLASDDARYVTGQVLSVDGGFSIHFPNWSDGGHVSAR